MRVSIFIITIIAVGSSMLMLAGCGENGWLRDRSKDYVKTHCPPPLKIPSHIKAEPASEEYQIPN